MLDRRPTQADGNEVPWMRKTPFGRLGPAAIALIIAGTLSACSATGSGPSTSATQGRPTSTGATPGAPATATNPTPAATATPWPTVVALPTTLPMPLTFEEMEPLFAYNGSLPLGMQVVASEDYKGATVQEITYAGAAGETIEAYLILPAGQGPFPAVLFEPGTGGTRDTFRAEALLLAQNRHIAGLLPTRPTGLDNGDDDKIEAILQVREMRRDLDLLSAQPQVDPSRLGYQGWSLGAMYGTILLPVEPRIKTASLMSTVPNIQPESAVMAIMARHIKTPTLLMQFGLHDSYYTKAEADAFAALIPAAHRVSWINAGHDLSDDAGTSVTERAAWLADQLAAK
jgi:dienelactone hydrolase